MTLEDYIRETGVLDQSFRDHADALEEQLSIRRWASIR